MVRWAIWYQVGLAVAATLLTLGDQRSIPNYLSPPPFAAVLLFTFPIPPVVVLKCGGRRDPGVGRLTEILITFGLALTTWIAILPLVR